MADRDLSSQEWGTHTVRPATADQVEISASILEEAAGRVSSDGYPSWTPGIFTGPAARGMLRLRTDLASRSLFLVWIGDAAVATFTLLERDRVYWPDAGDEALYLHRFAVRRIAAGIGRRAIDWMVAETMRRRRAYLRLDCLAENPGIRRYYESAGFVAVGEIELDGTKLALYEMRVPSATVDSHPPGLSAAG
jgi:hypothetical protein